MYGPPRLGSRRGPPGSIPPRGSPLPGIVAGVIALAVVGGVALFLLDWGRPARPVSTSPALVAAGSPSAGASTDASPGSSASPGASAGLPGASASPDAPSASPVETGSPSPEPSVGGADDPGPIIFGARANTTTFRIIGEATTFRLQHTISWRAELPEPAGTNSLRLQIARLDPSGTERVVVDRPDAISNTRAQILLRRHRLSVLLDQPGDYVVRYLRDDVVLAEGTLSVTP